MTKINSLETKKKNGTILLIDDNVVELKLVNYAMSEARMHHELVLFSKPLEALDYIKENAKSIFIIISDLKMPLMDGFELLEKVNEDREIRMHAIPFLFLSNSKDIGDVETAYSSGAQGFFLKPFELEGLTDICKGIVSYWHNAQIPRD